MQDCWRENLDDRPTFENLRDELKEMESQHQVTCEHSFSLLKICDSFFSGNCLVDDTNTDFQVNPKKYMLKLQLFEK